MLSTFRFVTLLSTTLQPPSNLLSVFSSFNLSKQLHNQQFIGCKKYITAAFNFVHMLKYTV